jgi:hypothetical protein
MFLGDVNRYAIIAGCDYRGRRRCFCLGLCAAVVLPDIHHIHRRLHNSCDFDIAAVAYLPKTSSAMAKAW